MELQTALNVLTTKLLKYDDNFFNKYNVEKIVLDILNEQNNFFYNDKHNHIVSNIATISSTHDETCMYIFNKLVMLNLIQHSQNNINQYPESIQNLFRERFQWIVDDVKSNSGEPYSFDNDIFRKDISICCLKMFPIGALVVHVDGQGKRFIVGGGPKQFVRSLFFYLFKMQRKYPFYRIHADSRCLHKFNRDGWNKCYLRISEMLKKHPEIRGLVGGTWFYDPALKEISPRLNYLREVPSENGAKFFRLGSSEEDINNATATSKTRKDLYLNGEYLPTQYVMVWMREDLIQWADANKQHIE